MRCQKENFGRFVLLTFRPGKRDIRLTDLMIERAMKRRWLRPVSRRELETFQLLRFSLSGPGNFIVAFGLRGNGPAKYGSFPGTFILNLNRVQEIEVFEDWVRAQDGWSFDCQFLFVKKPKRSRL